MKKRLMTVSAALAMVAVLFTACDDDYVDNTYINRNLVGQWDLISINNVAVSGYTVNSFDFYSNGSGYYYYWENGVACSEWLQYWCYDGYGSPVLHIDYQYSSPMETYFYFNSNYTRLYLQWEDYYGVTTTYEYEYVGDVQNYIKRKIESASDSDSATAGEVSASALRPGVGIINKNIDK